MSEPIEEVGLVYDASDFRALYRACSQCRRRAILISLFIPALFAVISYIDGWRGVDLIFQTLPYLLIGIGVSIGIYAVGPLVAVRKRRTAGWGEPMFVSLTRDGIVSRHPTQDSKYFWSKIQNVLVHGSRLFIFTTPGCAIILPRRCFASDRQFDDWSKRADELWRAAKNGRVE